MEGKPEAESSSEQEEADEEVSNAFRQVLPSHSWNPNKSQVLCYLSSAPTLHFKKTGKDLQVTDSSGFPLFDIWVKMDCFRQSLVVESYGRMVLLLTDNTNLFGVSTRKSEPPTITIHDWNGETFGYFVPGDPFIIENAKKITVAKLINLEIADSRSSGVWQCVLEGSGKDVATLEDCKTLRYAGNVGFQMRLLTLAAAVRIAAMRRAQPRSRCCLFSLIFKCCSCRSS
uniref:Ig-like domain-containing protein n=1 Tax=Steinernema glaseri TaxID=37863 RepID=A0A1I7Y6H5_9BILA